MARYPIFMPKERKPTVKDSELLSGILSMLETDDRMTSDFYIISNHNRIIEILKRLQKNGLIEYKLKEKGQQVPIYHLTERGRMFAKLDRLHRKIYSEGMDE